jgi:hypothetical protein
MLLGTLTTTLARLPSLLLVLAVSVTWARAAAAQGGQSVGGVARLQVEASSACASRDELVARVNARSPRVRFVDDDAALLVSARFSAASAPAGAIFGEVSFSSADSKPSARRVQANSCLEAADAVALIIAMTLDPTASRGDARPDEATRVEPSAPAPARRPLDEAPSNASDAAGSGPRDQASFGVQLAVQALLGPAPQVMPGVAVFGVASLERGSVWSPSVSIGATHAGKSETQEAGGNASFTLDAASFDACPLRLRLGAVRVRPCASVLIGRFSAQGSETTNAAAESRRPFWVLGGAAMASTELFWRLEATARVAIGASLVRDSFEFTPSVFHTVSSVTVAGSVGAGVRW